jgi:hypothetical protein
MARHILLVQSEPRDGRDDEYNQWYDEEHLPEVLEVAGFVAARRFVAVPGVHGELPAHPYLAIYEIETDDPAATLATLSTAARSMSLSPAFNRETQLSFAFSEISSRATE